MKIRNYLPVCLCIIMLPFSMKAAACDNWGNAEIIGYLDKKIFVEASGIEVSDRYKNRMYHINDSGKELELFVSDTKGKNVRKVKIAGVNNINSDNEDLSVGPCLKKTCIFIGDIGDNSKRRNEVKIIVINEKQNYPSGITPLKVLRVKYPDRPHNAEGLAVHPNGDIYIITKESDFEKMRYYPSKIYRLKQSIWENSTDEQIIIPEPAGEIDIGLFNGGKGFFLDNIITSFDISGDGKKFIILTYQNAYEFHADLRNTTPDTFKNPEKVSYRIINLIRLPQQEAVAYTNSDKGFIYDTEYIKNHEVEIYKVQCLN